MATLFTQDFNDLVNGDLNGQGGFSGATSYDVSATLPYEGAKGVENSQNSTGISIYKQGAETAAGRMTFYVRMSTQDGNCGFHISSTNSINQDNLMVGLNGEGGDDFQWRDSGGYHSSGIGFAANTWYCVEIEWTAADEFQWRQNSGAWQGTYDFLNGDNPEYLIIYFDNVGGATTFYFDYIAEDPVVHDYTYSGTDAITLAEIIGATALFRKPFTESVSLNGVLGGITRFTVGIIESINLDEILAGFGYFFAVTEQLTLNTISSVRATFSEIVRDTVSAIESSSVYSTFTKVIEEVISFVENFSATEKIRHWTFQVKNTTAWIFRSKS